MERHQRALHPKQLDDQAPTRAIEHDTFHNDAHSIRTKNNVKPVRNRAFSAAEVFPFEVNRARDRWAGCQFVRPEGRAGRLPVIRSGFASFRGALSTRYQKVSTG